MVHSGKAIKLAQLEQNDSCLCHYWGSIQEFNDASKHFSSLFHIIELHRAPGSLRQVVLMFLWNGTFLILLIKKLFQVSDLILLVELTETFKLAFSTGLHGLLLIDVLDSSRIMSFSHSTGRLRLTWTFKLIFGTFFPKLFKTAGFQKRSFDSIKNNTH